MTSFTTHTTTYSELYFTHILNFFYLLIILLLFIEYSFIQEMKYLFNLTKLNSLKYFSSLINCHIYLPYLLANTSVMLQNKTAK